MLLTISVTINGIKYAQQKCQKQDGVLLDYRVIFPKKTKKLRISANSRL